MKRYPELSAGEITARLRVDPLEGKCFWIDATKHHRNLIGEEAGNPKRSRAGKWYWIIKINGCAYRRSQIILAITSGSWPADMVDHIDGNSLNDVGTNLRHATGMQNAWNHKTRKKDADTPMGVRRLPSGRFQARIACENKQLVLGVFDSVELASAAYQAGRKEYFHAFC